MELGPGGQRVGPRLDHHRGRHHLGNGLEVRGLDAAEDARASASLEQHGEEAEVLAAGFGAEALGHLELDHRHHPLDPVQARDEPREDRGRAVVGEVADDPGLLVGLFGEVAVDVVLEEVAPLDPQMAGEVAPLLADAQVGDAVRVHLDRGHAGLGAEEVLGEGAVARADLEDPFAGADGKVAGDRPDDGVVAEEVLAEMAASGAVHGGKGSFSGGGKGRTYFIYLY